MKKFVQQGLLMFAGIVGLPAAVSHADRAIPAPECKKDDPRLISLQKFFRNTKCPIEHLAAAFIREADDHHLDWRLLPSLSVVESGGGKKYRNNNVFGWDNGNSSFGSIREGIHFVAGRLATSRFYRGKGVTQKLRTYNGDGDYARNVKSVMFQISGVAVLD